MMFSRHTRPPPIDWNNPTKHEPAYAKIFAAEEQARSTLWRVYKDLGLTDLQAQKSVTWKETSGLTDLLYQAKSHGQRRQQASTRPPELFGEANREVDNWLDAPALGSGPLQDEQRQRLARGFHAHQEVIQQASAAPALKEAFDEGAALLQKAIRDVGGDMEMIQLPPGSV